jgi:AcrR family transcriptional regulator
LEKDTRLKLIETATSLFAKKGFAAVSVRELARAAGANVAAISYHFGGKEGLYQAVLEEQFAPIALLLEKLPTLATASGEARLRFYADNIIGIHHQRPYFIRIMTSEMTNPTVGFNISRNISPRFSALSVRLWRTASPPANSGPISTSTSPSPRWPAL